MDQSIDVLLTGRLTVGVPDILFAADEKLENTSLAMLIPLKTFVGEIIRSIRTVPFANGYTYPTIPFEQWNDGVSAGQ